MKDFIPVTSLNSGTARRTLWAAVLLTLLLPMAQAQEPTITPNYREADIRQIIEAVVEVTG